MTSTSLPQPALVPRRTTTTGDPVRQALVNALIGAVLDELGGVARTTSVAAKNAPRRDTSARKRREMR